MKRMYFVALAMGAAIVQAAAADLPQRPVYTPAPVVVPTYNWTGFYLGGNLGGAWSSTTVTSNITGANWKPSSTNFIGGGQLGYNYQFPSNWVVGVEWTFDWGGGDKTSNVVTAPNGNQLQASANGASWLTTLAGRFGYGADRWLVYGKGGWAWLETSAQIRNLTTGAIANGDHTGSGWVGGAGVEYALTQNWTTKLEYNYIGSGNWSSPNNFIAGGTASYKAHIQTLVVGVNYKF
jgi:outer membrane immunogenic protein